MSTTATKEQQAKTVERSGTADVDTGVIGRLRAYLLASDEAREALARKETARAALDAATIAENITYAGAAVFRYRPGSRRKIDADRLAERWPEAYADVATAAATATLVVERDVELLLRSRTWRSALAKR